MPEHRYDVYDLSAAGGAFEIVNDKEMARLRDGTGDIGCDDGSEAVEIARGVSAATAAELVGLRPTAVAWLERQVAEHCGVFGVGNLVENWEVRLTAMTEENEHGQACKTRLRSVPRRPHRRGLR